MKRNLLVIVIAAGLAAVRAAGQGAVPVPTAASPQPAPSAGSQRPENARLLREMGVQAAAGGQDDPAAGRAAAMADEFNQAMSVQGGSYSTAEYSNPFGSWGGARESEGSVTVVDFKSPDQKTVDETGEDLKIMSILFAHNLGKAFASDQPDYKLGIPLLLKNQGHSVEASYIEGVGVLFSLRVRFPLIAPAVEETNAAPAQKDSAWARAQRELAGEPERSSPSGGFAISQESAPAYQSNLVETLKKQVIETLGETSNFRHLAPNESIMVTVTGAPNATATMKMAAYRADSDPTSQPAVAATITGSGSAGSIPVRWFGRHGLARRGSDRATLMTIRIKQSDAQALAEHKMSHEDFIKSAQVTTYLGPSAQPEPAGLQGR